MSFELNFIVFTKTNDGNFLVKLACFIYKTKFLKSDLKIIPIWDQEDCRYKNKSDQLGTELIYDSGTKLLLNIFTKYLKTEQMQKYISYFEKTRILFLPRCFLPSSENFYTY